MNSERLLEAFREYIDCRIDEEFVCREVGDDDHTGACVYERQVREAAWSEVLRINGERGDLEEPDQNDRLTATNASIAFPGSLKTDDGRELVVTEWAPSSSIKTGTTVRIEAIIVNKTE